jgi:hypothetical protein
MFSLNPPLSADIVQEGSSSEVCLLTHSPIKILV